MNFKDIFIAFCLLSMIFSTETYAQAHKRDPTQNVDDHLIVVMPELEAGSVILDDDNTPPNEPNILKSKFLSIPPPMSLEDRIEKLLHGIRVDTPPEYDHYGYEIRRYMSAIGNVRIFEDEEYLVEQIKNVRKARVIIEYWQAYIQKEVNELEEIVDADPNTSAIIKTLLKKNKADARSFMADAQRWIDMNERYLQKVYDLFEFLDLYYPELVFLRPHERIDFYNTLVQKQTALIRVKEYQPFAYMVY